VQDDPFAELGLPALAELTNDDVRAAWRRIAAATHPDREDGGDPARFGAAAAAYVLLKTPFGRGEALADLGGGAAGGRARRHGRARSARRDWYPRRPWRAPRAQDQRRGAHRLRAATPAPRFRHAKDAAIRVTRGAGTRTAGTRTAREGGFPRAGYARLRPAGYPRYRLAGYVTVDRGLARPAGAAALGAAAAIAVVGWTPATIGLVVGALTVTAWGLWRRAWQDR
jgi:curved DNA-binding protein CbpA